MDSSSVLNTIMQEMAKEYKRLFKAQLKKVYLYGSYARGDFDDESDIDIVGIVDRNFTEREISEFRDSLVKCASELGLEYDVLISPSVIQYERFREYNQVLPYYMNILKEGVELNVG